MRREKTPICSPPSANAWELRTLSSEPVVHSVWQSSDQLSFIGSNIPNYVSRWWPEQHITYIQEAALPKRLSVNLEGRKIRLL